MTPINIMVTRHAAFYSPLISAIAAGFLQQEGLAPSYAIATPQRSVVDGIRDGSIHLGQSAVSSNWGLLERGEAPDIVHFSQINERDGFFIAAREPDPDFNWTKLIGKQVLVDHLRQPLAMFKYAAHQCGVDYESIDSIDAGGVEEIDAAFRAGQGDYVHQQGPAPQQLEKEGIGYVVAAVGEVIGPVAFSSLTASREWLRTDMARTFMHAYRKARHYVNNTEAATIAKAQAIFFKGIDHDALRRAIELYQGLGCWQVDPRITREAYDRALDVFLHSGVISKRHAYDTVVVAPPDEG